jgi:hypothetical protein
MKCTACGILNGDSDTTCFACHRPLPRTAEKGPKSKVTLSATLCMIVAISGFNVLAPRWFPDLAEGGGISLRRAAWSGVVGAVAAVLGAGIGYCLGPTEATPQRRRRRAGGVSGAKVPGMAIVCMLVGVGIFNTMAPRWFPTPKDGSMNTQRLAWSAVVGAISAVAGFFISICMNPSTKD